MPKKRYPKLCIRSKNELSKHLGDTKTSFNNNMNLINDVQQNFDKYWRDNVKFSEPDKKKWVRDASGTQLGILLEKINKKILAPHDELLPYFIFGGIKSRNHKTAALHLLGAKTAKKRRILLQLDIKRFFEQIHYKRVYSLFLTKCACSHRGAKLLADMCCVSAGSKQEPLGHKTLARGFATSPRLATWCNLDTFLRLERLVQKELRGKHPRIAIYMDDIGITVSNTTKEELMCIYPKIRDVLQTDKNQLLPLNERKTLVREHSGETYDIQGNYLGKKGYEHLGLSMGRTSLGIGAKVERKFSQLKQQWGSSKKKNSALRRRIHSLSQYKNYIKKK